MSGSLLSRVSTFRPNSDLTPLQSQVDAHVGGFVQQATDWKSLAALTAGGVAYRLGKVGAMSARAMGPLSIVAGLGAEVSAFELTNRSLLTVQAGLKPAPTPNLWRWSGPAGLKQGLLSSLVTFSTLKGFGRLTQGQNLILQHGAQDTAMVLGHQLLHRAGIGPKPEGNLTEQFLHAETVSWQLKGGMALAHGFAPRFHAFERGLDLQLTPSPLSLSLEGFGGELSRTGEGGRRSGEGDLTRRFEPALAGADVSPVSLSSSSKPKESVSLASEPMASLGGGGFWRKDFPYVEEKVFEKGGTSLTIKVLSKNPIRDVNQVAGNLGEAFFNILVSGKEETSIQGPIASQLKENPELRALLLSPVKKVALQFDLDGREILTLRVFKDDLRMDLSVPRSSFTPLQAESPLPRLEPGPELAKTLDLPLTALNLSTKASLALINATPSQVVYVGHVVQRTEQSLSELYRVGPKTLGEIQAALAERGLSLGMRVDWLPPSNIFNRPVSDLDLSLRGKNILKWHGIEYLGQLVQKTPAELKKAPNVGRERVKEIQNMLRELGLSLGMRVDWQPPQRVLDMHILELGIFPPRMAPLLDMGIDTVSKLVERTESDLLLLCDGIDPKTVQKIKSRLAEMGLSLKQNPQEMDFLTRSKPEKIPPPPSHEKPTFTMILGFELPYAFDSAAFNLRGLDLLDTTWEKAQYAGMKLLQKMGKEFKANSEETNAEKKRRISETLDQAHQDLLTAVLTDRVRKGAGPQQVEQGIRGIDERLEAALAEVKDH